jgi:hypothetical protein
VSTNKKWHDHPLTSTFRMEVEKQEAQARHKEEREAREQEEREAKFGRRG